MSMLCPWNARILSSSFGDFVAGVHPGDLHDKSAVHPSETLHIYKDIHPCSSCGMSGRCLSSLLSLLLFLMYSDYPLMICRVFADT